MNWNSHQFVWLDWAVIVAGIALVAWAVWREVQKDKRLQGSETSGGYFLGKGEPWYVLGAAIFAANIGSEHLVGLAGAGAKTGLGMAHWEMQGWMILVLGWLFVPFYQHAGVFTMPEFLNRRYTRKTSSWLSIITLISYILTKVSVTAFTGGIFMESLLGLPFWYGAIGLIVLTGIFTVFGGMKGVMTLSKIQTPILIIGSFLVLFLGLYALGDGSIGGGWNAMLDHARGLNEGYGTNHLMHFDQNDPLYSQFPGFWVIAGSAIIGFWYWCTDQHIVQRVLGQQEGEKAADVMRRARRGTIAAGYLKVLPVFMFLIPGMIAAALAAKSGSGFEMGSTDEAFDRLHLSPGSLAGSFLQFLRHPLYRRLLQTEASRSQRSEVGMDWTRGDVDGRSARPRMDSGDDGAGRPLRISARRTVAAGSFYRSRLRLGNLHQEDYAQGWRGGHHHRLRHRHGAPGLQHLQD